MSHPLGSQIHNDCRFYHVITQHNQNVRATQLNDALYADTTSDENGKDGRIFFLCATLGRW